MATKYPCPCGAGDLIIRTTKKQGVNHNRKYLKCPSELGDCGFYSFLDELRLCKCRKGYCRNIFRKKVKYWCCPFKGTDAGCGFFSQVVLPSTSSKPQPTTPCQPSTSTPTTPGSTSTPTTPRSTSTPTTPRSTEEKRREAILRSLEASRIANNALVDIIQDLANLPLNDDISTGDAL